MIRTASVNRILAIAKALDGLEERFMFVGASVLGLLATEEGAPDPRPTEDVDLIAVVTNYAQNVALNKRLRARGFTEDVESPVLCRWRYQGLIVDIIPPDPRVLGFSNELYPSALAHITTVEIDGTSVPHIDAPHFIGTKLLAYEGRGKGDLHASHDLEDLFAVVNSRPEILEEIARAPAKCREVVGPRLEVLRANPSLEEAVEGYLANDVPGQHRVVLERLDAVLRAM